MTEGRSDAVTCPGWLGEPGRVWQVILGLVGLRLAYLWLVPVTPQEAYYWNYAQHPALGYFDHPPLIAYSMWLGTRLFGNTAFGLKVMGLVWSTLTSIVLYYAVLRARHWRSADTTAEASAEHRTTALLAVVLYNLTIFGHAYAVTHLPDTLLIFFWLLTIFFFQELLLGGPRRYWLFSGLAFGMALLSKYTAVALLPALFVTLLVSSRHRPALRTPYPYAAVAVATLLFLPVILWNAQHEWGSFAFQFAHRARSVGPLRIRHAAELLGSQTLLITPLALVLFLRTGWIVAREPRKHPAALFFFGTGVFIIAGFWLISLTTLVKINWLLPGYLGLIAATVLVGRARRWDWSGRWYRAGVAVSGAMIVLAHAVALIPNFPLGDGNTWAGWRDAADRIRAAHEACGGPTRCFLFSNGYKGASLLKFHIPSHPETYAQNVYGRPALQFDYWPLPEELRGKNALYVITDRLEYRDDLESVREHFEDVSLEASLEYTSFWGGHARYISYYRARGYRGPTIPAPVLSGRRDGRTSDVAPVTSRSRSSRRPAP